MNMKKTMAAIAAGAVAVSAMATSVSAVQDTTFTYSLVEQIKKSAGNTAILKASITDVDNTTTALGIALNGTDTVSSITIRVIPDNTTIDGAPKTYTFSTDPNNTNYVPGTILSNTKLDVTDLTKNLANKASIEVTSLKINTADGKIADANNHYAGQPIITVTGSGDVTPVVVDTYTKGTDTWYAVPFKTKATGNANIIDYLQNGNVRRRVTTIAGDNSDRGTAGQGKFYTNVAAVLNDAIANYEGVTFVFTTATQSIAWTISDAPTYGSWADTAAGEAFDKFYGKPGATAYNHWADQGTDGFNGGYEDALVKANGNEDRLIPVYSDGWWADDTYKSFNQHLYNGTSNNYYGSLLGNYAAEGTGYVGFDWNGYNLFQGALVINENLTMSLQETDYFDFTATTLSFDWDAIMDGAATSNNFATYVQSIKLATSTTWYWDSLSVVLTAGEAEDASVAAGVEGDDDSLGDDDTDDIDLGDDDDDIDLGDDDDDDDVAPADVTPEPAPAPAPNPQTGNAPVALAVIPVALAAAAVVAKKRG